MEKPEVLVTLPSSLRAAVHDLMERRLQQHGCALNALYSDAPLDESRLCHAIGSAAGYILALEQVTAKVIGAARRLRVISKFGIGTDNIDIAAAEHSGIAVANCPGSNSNAVAELAISLIISLLRDVQNECNRLRAGDWRASVGAELARKNVGIVGFGNIGRKVAGYLAPFGVKIRVFDAVVDAGAESRYGVAYTSLDELLAESDIVTIHLPLTPSTHHLLGRQAFNSIKPGAFVVNLARGGVVDELALLEAVQAGRVARAAVDVFENEPPTDSRLLRDDRFVVLPHIGGVTAEATMNVANMALDNVLEVLAGRAVPHPVTPH